MPDREYQSVSWRYVLDALKAHFRGRGVYAAGDLFVYLEEGNPRNCIAPDLFVVRGTSDPTDAPRGRVGAPATLRQRPLNTSSLCSPRRGARREMRQGLAVMR